MYMYIIYNLKLKYDIQQYYNIHLFVIGRWTCPYRYTKCIFCLVTLYLVSSSDLSLLEIYDWTIWTLQNISGEYVWYCTLNMIPFCRSVLFPCTCDVFHCFLWHGNISASACFYSVPQIGFEKVFHLKHFDLTKQNHILFHRVSVWFWLSSFVLSCWTYCYILFLGDCGVHCSLSSTSILLKLS